MSHWWSSNARVGVGVVLRAKAWWWWPTPICAIFKDVGADGELALEFVQLLKLPSGTLLPTNKLDNRVDATTSLRCLEDNFEFVCFV
jgi:hypothetical protein